MNEEQVKKILEIEDAAQAQYDEAIRAARQLPLTAQSDARKLIEDSRNQANVEAGEILRKAREEVSASISLQTAELEAKRKESVAMLHFDQAVYYVLDRILGKA